MVEVADTSKATLGEIRFNCQDVKFVHLKIKNKQNPKVLLIVKAKQTN